MLKSIRQKVQQGAEIVGTLKGSYDAGKIIHSGVRLAAPMAMALL